MGGGVHYYILLNSKEALPLHSYSTLCITCPWTRMNIAYLWASKDCQNPHACPTSPPKSKILTGIQSETDRGLCPLVGYKEVKHGDIHLLIVFPICILVDIQEQVHTFREVLKHGLQQFYSKLTEMAYPAGSNVEKLRRCWTLQPHCLVTLLMNAIV